MPLLPPAVSQWLQAQRAAIGICLFLAAATMAVYGQTVFFEFVSFDDDAYVYANRHVRDGLSLAGVKWAFTGVHEANWHPLTTLSHQLDCSLWGLWAGGHHLTNVLLHAVSSIVLFLALRRLTGTTWRSGLVAALFCLHPLHVESVAWVSERKDVLSGLFFGLTLWAYAFYVSGTRRAPTSQGAPSGPNTFPWGRYGLVLVLFALGLLCKPMLVTTPFVLLLLDIWPLQRWTSWRPRSAIILEKLPMLALAAASCAVTYVVQQSHGTISEDAPLGLRIQTALTAYGSYLLKTFVPIDLAASYPPWRESAIVASAACFVLLAALSVAAVVCARRGGRYAVTGWFWFLGMIVPASGIILIGDQSMADRYTYLPLTGVFIVLVFAAGDLLKGRAAMWGMAAAAVVLGIFLGLSVRQTRTWSDSETLFRHILATTTDNALTHTNLAVLLNGKGPQGKAEAEAHIAEALRIKPDYSIANNNRGMMLADDGDWEGAIRHYNIALKSRPSFAIPHNNLGVAWGALGQSEKAEAAFREAVRLEPEYAQAENNLGYALAMQKRWNEAIEHYRRSIDLEPDNGKSYLNLGLALANLGVAKGNKDLIAEGVAECERGVKMNSGDADAHHELAKLYHSLGRLQDAANEWQATLKLNPTHAAAIKGLGTLLVQSGRGAEAIPFLQASLRAAPNDLETRQFMVLARLAGRQTAAAMAEFRQLLKLDPKGEKVLNDVKQAEMATPKDVYLRTFRAHALVETGRTDDAIAEFREILRLDAKNTDALNSLAWIEATSTEEKLRNGKEAIELAQKAVAPQGSDVPQLLDTLAAAYAEGGRFKEAVETARKAKAAAEKGKDKELTDGIAERLKLYEAGKPYREKTTAE